jgi:ribonuclease D
MEFIQSEAELEAVGKRLEGVALIAADTEAAGYHRYSDRVCLLQISTRDATFIVDTLAVPHLDALQPAFGGQESEIIFHDADYDLRLLGRDFGMQVTHLFDTKTAAQFLGERSFGLGSLVEKFLGIKLEKKHQRADWAQRPLPDDMLAYAAEDTQHLPALRDRLREELVAMGRLKWAEEEFRITEHTRWPDAIEGEGYLKIKGARDLKPRQLAALRELHRWREDAAEVRDVAVFRVLSNEGLLEIARRMPADSKGLEGVTGMSPSVIERRGPDLLAAVKLAAELPENELPKFPRGVRRPPPDAEFDTRAEKLKAARDKIADELNLDRGFLLQRNQIEEIARANPTSLAAFEKIEGIRKWQVEAVGAALLTALI